jgi:hypothetical protein
MIKNTKTIVFMQLFFGIFEELCNKHNSFQQAEKPAESPIR